MTSWTPSPPRIRASWRFDLELTESFEEHPHALIFRGEEAELNKKALCFLLLHMMPDEGVEEAFDFLKEAWDYRCRALPPSSTRSIDEGQGLGSIVDYSDRPPLIIVDE